MTDQQSVNIQLPSAYRLAAFESLDSTNDEARRNAVNAAPEGLVVLAKEQTKGRGRRGRTWISEPGNLFCSLLLRPHIEILEAAKLSFVAALAIHSTIEEVAGHSNCDIKCKWPNDVLVDGNKISGILLESQAQSGQGVHSKMLDWLIVGIGINLCHCPDNTPYPAGYVNAYRAYPIAPEQMLTILITQFDYWFKQWQSLGFQGIQQEWLKRAKGVGEEITVNLQNEVLTGIFETLDPDGCLVLRHGKEKRIISAGDVFFGPPR